MNRTFNGTITVDIGDSVPDWTPFEPPTAPEGAPNVNLQREAAAMLARE